MKTLDEVIKALEWCIDDSHDDCEGCPYDTGEVTDCHDRNADALHYLKAFQDAKDTLEREKDRYAEAVRNCEQAEGIYKQKQKAAEDMLWICKEDKDDLTALRAYWKEQHENDPLTWEQLKQMEGKPVLVVVDEKERWRIIREVTNEHLILESGLPLHKCWMNHPDGWRAYRKEKE